MRIAIIGGGAVGLLFAHYLNENHEVLVYVRNLPQLQKLRKNGLTIERNGVRSNTRVKACQFSEWKGEEDLTIVAVKQYSIPELAGEILKMNAGKSAFLFLQNGMGHLKWAEMLKADNLFVGSVEHGALKTEPDTVLHTGIGVTKVAALKGDVEFLKKISDSASCYFPFIFVRNHLEMLIQKLIVNSLINPLTAVLRVRNGELLSNKYYYRLFLKLFDEVSAILNIPDKASALSHVKSVCEETGMNRSSMLKDIEEGRETEIDAILGYILKEAEMKKISAPYTESLYCQIKGRERGK
ncbi:2-dehydropantoate 2-reductase [Cytobacillus firmus]|uniref:2-dehydropantoate 2-reductase n=1 Tax=Cytobacillus firmus TaxID=1399 RepID=UPI0018CE8562|nr:2-dehydropantoate 2-reductase [Cytobacillus firmus]MBG9550202.1 2-dehydropantoate 2-reductase [Cytobacillus firmus]MBG9601988.1 2-dehydropantoate 2-reductase [Cytobacillus firmus]MED1941341.1 2-dehydropantoate 2-reductase [Cytobacillus firmus]